jgi:hypothetical protein
MIRPTVARLEHPGGDVHAREVRDRVAPRLVEQHDVIALGDPGVGEPDAHPPAERFGVNEALRQRLGDQKPSEGSGC